MTNPIKVIKAAAKVATRAKTDAIQKNSVKVKPAAKQKPGVVSKAKLNYKQTSTVNRVHSSPTFNRDIMGAQLSAKLARKVKGAKSKKGK